MDFLKNAAGEYMNSQSGGGHPQGQGPGQQGGGGNFDFIQQAAGKYMGSEDRPSAGGNGGGLDWQNLSRLTDQYSFLDKNKDGTVDAKDFMGYFSGGGSKPSQLAQQAGGNQAGAPPAGYPTHDGKAGNPDVVSQLLNKFQNQHGQSFQGTDDHWSMLSNLASSVTGKNIPLPVLKKLVSWKLGGMI